MTRPHITDEELLLLSDGELSANRMAEIQEHLANCYKCRERKAEMEETFSHFAQSYRAAANQRVPSMELSLDKLNAELDDRRLPIALIAAAAVLIATLAGVLLYRDHADPEGEFAPRAALTPGAVRPVNRQQVCSATENTRVRLITTQTAENVFREYGIRDPRPRTYEVDYLIPPDLGGTEDPRNLWPQPYAAGVWNARVKDALEDRLRMLVCAGNIDVATAQRDLARDWIAAYKKYFRTQQPLVSHAAFIKDRPWE